MIDSPARGLYPFRTTTRPGIVTCVTCGCRLTPAPEDAGIWYHFTPLGGRDARGCVVACADLAHDPSGHTVASPVA